MPIPRVLLHVADRPKVPDQSEIIDGQQRCTILAQFRADGFALTSAVDDSSLQGKRYSDLSHRQKVRFEEYKVPIDKYIALTAKQIRQVFRRLNYYTAPLNAAEQRHAQFFGELSRFVEKQSTTWRNTFGRLRVFTKRQRIRKADEQLMAEVVDAMLNGFSTPTAKTLRDVYLRYEPQFPSAGDFRRRLDSARATIDGWRWLGTNILMRKHYHVFALMLAVMHAEGALVALKGDLGPHLPLLSDDEIREALGKLASAVEREVATGPNARFWNASREKTNVKKNRMTRTKYLYMALTGAPIS